MGGLLAFLCVKSRGVGRGDFVTLIRVSSQKAVQSQGIFPARLVFIMLLAETPCIKSSQIYICIYFFRKITSKIYAKEGNNRTVTPVILPSVSFHFVFFKIT